MENVTNKRCADEACKKQPVYAIAGEKATHCKTHKSEHMVDVKHIKCGHMGCKKIPSYGIDKGKPLMCADHRITPMRNVVSPECAINGCSIQPCYNFDGERPKFCKGHSESDMINVRNATCESCGTRPTFGLEGQNARFCIKHKTSDMVDVKSQRCTVETCPKRRYYAFEGDPAQFCDVHMLPGMLNVCSHRCEGEACSILPLAERTSAGYRIDERWLCMSCLRYERPMDERVVKLLRKEHVVLKEIRNRIPELDPFFKSFDRPIEGGCSRRRPDMWLDLGLFHVILEVDENCHRKAAYSCEWRRMCELFLDGGSMPMIFLRINPDYDEDGRTAFKEYVATSGERVVHTVPEVFDNRMSVIEEELRGILESAGEHRPKDLDVRFFFYKERAVSSADAE